MPLARALVIALAITIPLSLWFALRMGVVIGPVLTYVLWRGVGPRILIAAAAGLLGVVVPLLYLVVGPENEGGFSFGYSNSMLLAHWTAITAMFLLALATWRMLAAARARPAEPREPPPPEWPRGQSRRGDRRDLAHAGRSTPAG
jgi:hypothetical protein